jgi:hypothetical protein
MSRAWGLRGETIDWRPQPEVSAASATTVSQPTMYLIRARSIKNPSDE